MVVIPEYNSEVFDFATSQEMNSTVFSVNLYSMRQWYNSIFKVSGSTQLDDQMGVLIRVEN